MGKKIGMILSLLLVSIFTLNFVSANWIDELGGGFQNVYKIIDVLITNFITPFVQLVLTSGNDSISGDMLFAKLLFFLIILGVVHFALNRISFFEDQNKGLYGIVVGVVAILATRYLGSEALIQTIILPYSVLGIAISAGLPFIIYALFIDIGFKDTDEHDYHFLRTIAWILFITIFIGLWFERRVSITQAGNYAGWIYPIIIIAAFIMWFADRRIQIVLTKQGLPSIEKARRKLIPEFERQVNQLVNDAQAGLPYVGTSKKLQKEIEKLRKRFGF